ncbi:hypothetical protein [Crucivirus-458]|nr:hypothetical protein [Crucivirus-458]
MQIAHPLFISHSLLGSWIKMGRKRWQKMIISFNLANKLPGNRTAINISKWGKRFHIIIIPITPNQGLMHNHETYRFLLIRSKNSVRLVCVPGNQRVLAVVE